MPENSYIVSQNLMRQQVRFASIRISSPQDKYYWLENEYNRVFLAAIGLFNSSVMYRFISARSIDDSWE